MKNSKELELPRKIFHMCFGTIYLFLYLTTEMTNVFISYTVGFYLITILSIYVVNGKTKNKLLMEATRESSPVKGLGSLIYLFGLSLTIVLENVFHIDKEIVVYAFITLSIGDGIATPIGKACGNFMKSKMFQKNYFAGFSAVIISTIVVCVILNFFEYTIQLEKIVLYVSFGMFLEFILGHKIIRKCAHNYCIDNFIIPVGIICLSIIL